MRRFFVGMLFCLPATDTRQLELVGHVDQMIQSE